MVNLSDLNRTGSIIAVVAMVLSLVFLLLPIYAPKIKNVNNISLYGTGLHQ